LGRVFSPVDRLQLDSPGTDNGLWDWDLITNRIHYSSGWTSMLGFGGTNLGNTAEAWFSRIHPEDSDSVQREIKAQIAQGSAQFEIPHRMLHQDGCYRWMVCRGVIARDNTGQATRITGFHLDKTDEKVVDALTGLPNRLLLLERLARSIDKAKRQDDFAFAVLVVDLDLFESGINRLDTINTESLIVTAARRIETSLGGRDISMREGRAHLIARSGGEEFTVLLDGLTETGEAKRIAEKLLKEILAPFELNGKAVFLTPSIGIALSATRYRHAEEALRDADTALYRAKSLGKSRCEVFDTTALEPMRNRNQLEQEIQRALKLKEFIVYYQPIVSLSTKEIAGFEALVRWNHPSRGMVSPVDFIPAAEKTGLIIPLDLQVLHQACSQLKHWKEDPRVSNDIWVSVNLSSAQFLQPSLAKDIQKILLETGLDANSLTLELTESAVMENPEAARNLLMQLHLIGTRIALDDFGTGYSSLSYLRRFPLDYLKVDHSFVRDIDTSKDSLEITRAISLLARQLGLQVIAEGIENPSQLELIQSLECECGQGFLFSKAVDSRQAEKLLLEGFASGEEIQSSATSSGHKSSAPEPDRLAEAVQKLRFIPSRKYLLTGLLACVLLISLSLVARFKYLGSEQSHPPSPPARTTVLEPVKPGVLSTAAGKNPQKNDPIDVSAATRSQSPAAVPSNAREKPNAPAAIAYSTAVRTAVLEPAKQRVVSTAAGKSPQKNDPADVAATTRSQSPAAVPSIVGKKATAPAAVAYSEPVRTKVLEPAKPWVLSTAAEERPHKNDPIDVSATTHSQSPAAVPSIVREKAAAPAAVEYSVSVIHDHVLGSCQGILRFTRHQIYFDSSKDKDSFVFAASQCSYALDRDCLTIKVGSTVYRFRSATAQNKAENRSQLSDIYQSISNLHNLK
jgi:diguanylate cyclase (GGDEF)-like protein